MKIPDRARTREGSPRFPAPRREVRCQPSEAAPATSLIAQNYAGVALPVTPLWPGSKCLNSPRQGNATIGANRILAWWTRWLTANVGVGLGRTRGGQAT